MIKRFNKKGFTLVEIIVVLVILAILAAIAVPSVLGYVEEAKKEKYIAEAKAIYTVIQVEEARLENEIDYTDKGDSYHNMEDMYKKLRNNTADNPDGENIISNKVGIKSMDWIYSNESKKTRYIEEAHSIYTVIQTEEARYKALGNELNDDTYNNTHDKKRVKIELSA